MVDESLQEIILAAFLAGVKAGVIEQGVPEAKKIGKQGGKRVVRGRSKSKPGGALRKPSLYQKKYGQNFRKVAPKYKKKDGGWKKDGFKRAQAEAHRLTKKEMKK